MTMSPHGSDVALFVMLSYAVAGLGWSGLLLWAWLGKRRVQRKLARLEARNTRMSE